MQISSCEDFLCRVIIIQTASLRSENNVQCRSQVWPCQLEATVANDIVTASSACFRNILHGFKYALLENLYKMNAYYYYHIRNYLRVSIIPDDIFVNKCRPNLILELIIEKRTTFRPNSQTDHIKFDRFSK